MFCNNKKKKMLHFQKKQNMRNSIKKNIPFYVMFIPVLIYFVIFRYVPLLLSLIISLEKYQPAKGIFSSKWVGIEYYKQFINSVFFQTVTDLPNFSSSVVVVGMVVTFLSPSTGLVNNILAHLGMERINFLTEPSYFWGIYTVMTIWQTAGYSAIIYLASLTGISSELYEAARIDGAGRWAQLFNITLPGLTPTIVLLFLMKIGRVLDVGYETIVLMYNPSIYSTADVIGTYVYRRGILNGEYSFASAVGFFQSVIGLMLVLFANKIAKKTSETSLW